LPAAVDPACSVRKTMRSVALNLPAEWHKMVDTQIELQPASV